MAKFSGLAVLLVAACGACGGASGGESESALILSPEPALESVTRRWADEWSAATGIPILVGAGGVPVAHAEAIIEDGDEKCARTRKLFVGDEMLRVEWIRVDPTPPGTCPSQSFSVAHEIAHALGASRHTEVSGVLFSEETHDGIRYTIDEASLAAVCEQVECPSFETPSTVR